MPSTNYKVLGVDVNSLYEPIIAGDTLAAATGYTVAGADLNTLFAPASVGSASSAITNLKQAGVEISPRFAAIGSRASNALSLFLEPAFFVNGYNPSDGPGTTSAGCTATASHGAPAYTYLWSRVGGSTNIVAFGTTTRTVTFQYTSSSLASIVQGVWRCTVTDSIGSTIYADVDVNMQVGGEPP